MPPPEPNVLRNPSPLLEKPKLATPALSFTEQHELKKLPDTIAALEKEMAELQAILATESDLYMKDPLRFDKTMRLIARAQAKLEEAEARWLELESKTAN